jgi:hypothetical protein
MGTENATGETLDVPIVEDFWDGVRREKAYQAERWGSVDDRNKQPADWFWLVGYLAGKALASAVLGDRDKALHHTISASAALAHWHDAIKLGHPDPSRSSDLEKAIGEGVVGSGG